MGMMLAGGVLMPFQRKIHWLAGTGGQRVEGCSCSWPRDTTVPGSPAECVGTTWKA